MSPLLLYNTNEIASQQHKNASTPVYHTMPCKDSSRDPKPTHTLKQLLHMVRSSNKPVIPSFIFHTLMSAVQQLPVNSINLSTHRRQFPKLPFWECNPRLLVNGTH